MLILLHRCLASYGDVGSYCFAAATCELSEASWIRSVQYVSGTYYSVVLGTLSNCLISFMVQTVIVSFTKLTLNMCFPYSEREIA